MTDYENKVYSRIEELIHGGTLSNDFLVSVLKLSSQMLNLKRVSEYSKENNKTTQWIRKVKKDSIILLHGTQMIIDNE